jgi:glutamate racemase
MNPSPPIGIFDSGIGGLTVAQAIRRKLPNENIIYFGDTAHLPYGDKSAHAIQAYAIKICDFLLKNNCKTILIACNSASAAAYELVKEYTASKAKVLNVIDPIVDFVSSEFANKKIGLIGTRATVQSIAYRKKIKAKNQGIDLKSVATPLLASMIEEGFFNNSISKVVIEKYLSNKKLAGIEGLILACTHYPLIKSDIQAFYKKSIEIIDGSAIVADALETYLTQTQLKNPQEEKGNMQFFVSDFTQSFEASSKLFFDEKVNLVEYPLWE